MKRLFNLFKSFISECEAYAIAFVIITTLNLHNFIKFIYNIFLEEYSLLKYTKNIYLNYKEKGK